MVNTWEDHQDYDNLVNAVEMIKGIADYVNERIKALERLNRVYEIDIILGGECKVFHLFTFVYICHFFITPLSLYILGFSATT